MELLVACVILAIGIVGMSQLYLAAMFTFEKSRYLSVGTGRAQEEMEFVQNIPFQELRKSIDGEDFIMENNEDGVGRFPDAKYDQVDTNDGVTFTIDTLPRGEGFITIKPHDNMKDLIEVTVEVTWEGARPVRSPVRIVTLVSN